MALNINSNVLSLNAQYNLGKASNALSQTMTRLSTGLKINSASDNAAGLAIAQGLTADINIYHQGISNAGDGVNLLNVADGALQSMTDNLQRLVVLSQQASNGTLGTGQKANIGAEFGKILASVASVGVNTAFNGIKLLDGTAAAVTIPIAIESTGKFF